MIRIVPLVILIAIIAFQGWNITDTVHPDATPAAQASRKDTLSAEKLLPSIIAYIKEHNHLPDFYLTKQEAFARGWVPSRGNLARIAPGMMIGGDEFTNSQDLLPQASGRIWYEADFDYSKGTRNAKRILYSSDGLIYVTYDHYKTVIQQ